MSFFQNIQETNKRQQSSYPFSKESTLLVGKYIFPTNWIKSLSVQVQSATFPLYISRIYTQEQTVFLDVIDKASILQCRIVLENQKSIVQTSNKITCGQIQIEQQLYTWLKDIIKSSVYGYIELPTDSLILDSCVLRCVHYIGCVGLSVNNEYMGSRVLLNFQRNVDAVIDGQNLQLNVYGDYTYSYENAKKINCVNNVEIKGASLLFQHRSLSDLRVVTENGKITLMGVTDAT